MAEMEDTGDSQSGNHFAVWPVPLAESQGYKLFVGSGGKCSHSNGDVECQYSKGGMLYCSDMVHLPCSSSLPSHASVL